MPIISCWPVHVHRQEDELLSSWLTRLALQHGIKLQSFCHVAFPDYQIWTRDIDKTVSTEFIQLLSTYTGETVSEIYAATLRSFEGYLFEREVHGYTPWILPLGIYHRLRKLPGLSFCPTCLLEDRIPYYRRLWRLAFYTVCHKHHVLLQNRCSRCFSTISFHRNFFKGRNDFSCYELSICSACGFDLRRTPSISIADTLPLQQVIRLISILGDGYATIGNSKIHALFFFRVFHHLLKLLLIDKHGYRLQQYLAEQLFHEQPRSLSQARTVEGLSLDERRYAIKLAFLLLENWPTFFIETCQKVHLSKSRLNRDFSNVPFWYSKILLFDLNESPYFPSKEEVLAVISFLEKRNLPITSTGVARYLGYHYGDTDLVKTIVSNYRSLQKQPINHI